MFTVENVEDTHSSRPSYTIPEPMAHSVRDIIERLLAAYETRDQEAALDLFADDAVFFDPHYPNPHMEGKEAIDGAIGWVFANMNRLGFTIRNYFEAEGGEKAAVEVDSNHELGNGQAVQFPQVFVVETDNGKITRLQAYEPYGPPTQ